MSDHWHPIRVYEVGATAPAPGTTRRQIVSWLETASPDRISAAGENYVEAAKLIQDDGGIQDAIMEAASKLATVWRGESATTALQALRLLYASAGALADAMHSTGKPMTDYAREVTSTRDKVVNQGGPGLYTAPPTGDGGGTTGIPNPQPLPPPPDPLADARARQDLENLNVKIASLNSQISEGLSFQMPDITPLDVELDKQQKLDPGSGSGVPTGRTTYWHEGDGGAGGSTGGSTGSTGSTGGSGTDGQVDAPPQDQNGGGTDPGQQDDDPVTDPQDPGAQQPGGQNQPPGQDPANTSPGGQDQQGVPPVIGADNPQTQLAEVANQATTAPGGNAYTTSPNATAFPNGQNAVTNPYASNPYTANPYTSNPFAPNAYAPNQPGGNMWYGSNGTGPAASPAVLRGGAGAPGAGGFMGYPPGAGMGGGAGQDGQERTREIYDPEPSVWSVSHETSPDKIG